MAYNNNFNRNNGYNNGNRGYNNQGFNQGFNQQQYKKHSGAKMTKYTPTQGPNAGHEQIMVTGWRLAGKDLISVKCVTTEKSKLSEKGWIGSIACTLTNTKTGEVNFHWGTMQKATGKVVIDKLAMVLNPKARNGGYCGTFLNR